MSTEGETQPESIEGEISRLSRIQETTSMSLQEEKRLLKEVDSLEASKLGLRLGS